MIAELGLRITSDGTVKAVSDLKQLETAAGRAQRTVTGMATGIHHSSRRLGQATSANRNFGLAVQNSSYQVADFAVQVASGTSASRALAQQLPQLLGGFGVLGAAIGAVVAIGGALVPMLFRMGEGAEDAGEALDDYADALSEYRDAVDAATAKTDDLIDRFGQQAIAMRETLKVMQQLEMQEALETMRNSVRFVATEFEGLFQAVDDFASAQDAISGIGEAFLSSADVRFVEEMRRNLASVAEQMGITSGEAVQLREAIGAIGQASGVGQVISATAELERLMLDVFGTVENIPPELQRMLANVLAAKTATAELSATMVDAGVSIGGAADEAGRLAGNLALAMQNRANLQSSKTYSGRGGDPRQFMEGGSQADFESSADRPSIDKLIKDLTPKTKKSGGGGKSDFEKDAEAAKKIMEQARSEAEKYADSLAEIERLQQAGHLSTSAEANAVAKLALEYSDADTAAGRYAEALANIQALQASGQITADQMGEAVARLKVLMEEAGDTEFEALQQGIENISDSIADAIVNGENLGEAFSSILRQMAADIVSSGIRDLLTQMLTPEGGGGGGIVASIISAIGGGVRREAKGDAFLHGDVTPFARGGIVTGPTLFPMRNGMGLMGEAGPEAVMPLKRGPDGKLGVQSDGGGSKVDVRVYVDRDGNWQAAVERISGRMMAAGMEDADRGFEARMAQAEADPRVRR